MNSRAKFHIIAPFANTNGPVIPRDENRCFSYHCLDITYAAIMFPLPLSGTAITTRNWSQPQAPAAPDGVFRHNQQQKYRYIISLRWHIHDARVLGNPPRYRYLTVIPVPNANITRVFCDSTAKCDVSLYISPATSELVPGVALCPSIGPDLPTLPFSTGPQPNVTR